MTPGPGGPSSVARLPQARGPRHEDRPRAGAEWSRSPRPKRTRAWHGRCRWVRGAYGPSLQAADARDRPVDRERPTDDVVERLGAVRATVLAVGAVVSHDIHGPDRHLHRRVGGVVVLVARVHVRFGQPGAVDI